MEHIFLGQQVDAIVIAPATANFIGKVACGIGDDLLTTIMLAATRPVLVCPAMNCEMWANPAVQENVARLESRGIEDYDAGGGRTGLRGVGVRAAAGARDHRRGPGPAGVPPGPGRPAAAGHRGAHPRGPGPGALPDQPQQRQDGLRRGQGGPAPGRGRDPGERPHRPGRPLRRRGGAGQVGGGDAHARSRGVSPAWTPSSWPRRWATTGRKSCRSAS